MDFYTNMAGTAYRLLAKFGRDLVIDRPGGSYDPVAGDYTAAAANGPHSFKGVVLPASKGTSDAFDNRIMEGVELSRVRFVVAEALSIPFEPQKGDEVTIGNHKYLVKGATPINPAGQPIVYKMGCTR